MIFLSHTCSFERPGCLVPGERAAARQPASNAAAGCRTGRRSQQQQQQQSGQRVRSPARALRGGCRWREERLGPACRPSPSHPGPHPSPAARPALGQSAESCRAARAAGSGGRHCQQTALGYDAAAERRIARGQYPAVWPHHQLCQLAAQPQGPQPVAVARNILDPRGVGGSRRLVSRLSPGLLTLVRCFEASSLLLAER